MRTTLLLSLAVVAASSCALSPDDTDAVSAEARGRQIAPPSSQTATQPAAAPRCAGYTDTRTPYFGDLHVHTSYSFDAYLFETRNEPSDAYDFAKGEPLWIAPIDEYGRGTRRVQMSRPLDFAAVTDHSEYLGEVAICTEPGHPAYDSSTCRTYRHRNPLIAFALWGARLVAPTLGRWGFCDDGACDDTIVGVWQSVQDAAHDAYEPCDFTSFVGYEWTGSGSDLGPGNLHRNVIFRNDVVPQRPTSFFDQSTADGLWAELDAACASSGTGCEVLAIPHNSNLSNGQMFLPENSDHTPLNPRTAALRQRMEPLAEITQVKGESECSLTVFPNDEECNFEKMGGGETRADYVRGALGEGLLQEQAIGVNPFRLGLIGSTDTHNATPGDVEELDYLGSHGIQDDTAAKQLTQFIDENPGGLAVVWSEQNTRDSIFDAFTRRETYGTSGTRIILRFFGGWTIPRNLTFAPGWEAEAYARGVPMGGDLGVAPRIGAPRFAVAAEWDPGTLGQPGTTLERVQIIKGWVDAQGNLHERVFDVAGDTNHGAAVDLDTCTTNEAGAPSLYTVWTDPTFHRGQRAYYYARVLEDPSCRWSTRVCNELQLNCDRPFTVPRRYRGCCDEAVPKTIQERAWSSPIWYSPEAS